MSSEKRVVRPYVGLDVFQSTLDRWLFRVGPEHLLPGDQKSIPSSSYLNDHMVLQVAADAEEVLATVEELSGAACQVELATDEVELVVIVSTPFLRMADVALRLPVGEMDSLPPAIDLTVISPPVRALETPAGGCNVDVYFVLAAHKEPVPLRPSRKGTWLGHIRFAVRTELGDIGFTPQPLTNQVRQEYSLHADTIRHVVADADALAGEELSAIELYVDDDVLAHLNQAPNGPAARFFQRQLFLDVIGAIVRTVLYSDDLRKSELEEFEGSVLDRVVGAAAGKGEPGESRSDLQNRREEAWQLMRTQPERFLAMVEARITPRDDLKAALGGGDD